MRSWYFLCSIGSSDVFLHCSLSASISSRHAGDLVWSSLTQWRFDPKQGSGLEALGKRLLAPESQICRFELASPKLSQGLRDIVKQLAQRNRLRNLSVSFQDSSERAGFWRDIPPAQIQSLRILDGIYDHQTIQFISSCANLTRLDVRIENQAVLAMFLDSWGSGRALPACSSLKLDVSFHVTTAEVADQVKTAVAIRTAAGLPSVWAFSVNNTALMYHVWRKYLQNPIDLDEISAEVCGCPARVVFPFLTSRLNLGFQMVKAAYETKEIDGVRKYFTAFAPMPCFEDAESWWQGRGEERCFFGVELSNFLHEFTNFNSLPMVLERAEPIFLPVGEWALDQAIQLDDAEHPAFFQRSRAWLELLLFVKKNKEARGDAFQALLQEVLDHVCSIIDTEPFEILESMGKHPGLLLLLPYLQSHRPNLVFKDGLFGGRPAWTIVEPIHLNQYLLSAILYLRPFDLQMVDPASGLDFVGTLLRQCFEGEPTGVSAKRLPYVWQCAKVYGTEEQVRAFKSGFWERISSAQFISLLRWGDSYGQVGPDIAKLGNEVGGRITTLEYFEKLLANALLFFLSDPSQNAQLQMGEYDNGLTSAHLLSWVVLLKSVYSDKLLEYLPKTVSEVLKLLPSAKPNEVQLIVKFGKTRPYLPRAEPEPAPVYNPPSNASSQPIYGCSIL